MSKNAGLASITGRHTHTHTHTHTHRWAHTRTHNTTCMRQRHRQKPPHQTMRTKSKLECCRGLPDTYPAPHRSQPQNDLVVGVPTTIGLLMRLDGVILLPLTHYCLQRLEVCLVSTSVALGVNITHTCAHASLSCTPEVGNCSVPPMSNHDAPGADSSCFLTACRRKPKPVVPLWHTGQSFGWRPCRKPQATIEIPA